MSGADDALFDVGGKVVVITGGSGVLGRVMAVGLGRRGATVVVVSRRAEACEAVAADVRAGGGAALGLAADVLDRDAVVAACARVVDEFGRVDALVNAAGGNHPDATARPDQPFFDLPPEAIQHVFGLNAMGTIIPSQVFGRCMADRGEGGIVNISSMAAAKPLTRVVAYSAAKAAIDNFTEWLATYMAQNFTERIRVNAIAPGFFETEQNRFLLRDADSGELTERGRSIVAHTPMGRFGEPDELLGALVWLLADASRFVTGIVVPVDGGFNAFGGI